MGGRGRGGSLAARIAPPLAMVLLHVKRSEDQQFLYETTTAEPVTEAIRKCCEIHNMRQRIGRLKMEGEDLAKHGPSKPLDKQGLDDAEEEDGAPPRPPTYCADPTGRRTGEAPDEKVKEMLMKTLEDAYQAAHKDQVAKKVPLSTKVLNEHIDTIRGAVMIAFPMGLPEWDPVRLAIEDDEDLGGTAASKEVLDPAATTMWWAGKQMNPDKVLADHVGKNEKTKIIAKLQSKGSGAPSREPAISQEEHKEMLAYYYKKQEEQKKFEENEDDDYAHSSWADPKSLKSHFAGTGGGIRTPGGARGGGFNGGMF